MVGWALSPQPQQFERSKSPPGNQDPGRNSPPIMPQHAGPLKLADRRHRSRSSALFPPWWPSNRVGGSRPTTASPASGNHVGQVQAATRKAWDMLALWLRSGNGDFAAPSPPGHQGRRLLQRCRLAVLSSTAGSTPQPSSSAKAQQSLQSGLRSPASARRGAENPTSRIGQGAAHPSLALARRASAFFSGQPGPPRSCGPQCPTGTRPPVAWSALLPALWRSSRAPSCLRRQGPALHMAAHAREPWRHACCRPPFAPLPYLRPVSAGGAPVGWPPGAPAMVPSHCGGAPSEGCEVRHGRSSRRR